MADTYSNYEKLAADHVEGTDYAIDVQERGSRCVVAPHAGRIEFMTGKIATETAASEFGLYLFEGKLHKDNRKLHITSHNFDEPRFLVFIAGYELALGIHGRRDEAHLHGETVIDRETVFLGGRNAALVQRLEKELLNRGFRTLGSGHNFPAKHNDNVCNRAQQKGAQVEIPLSLRESLKKDDGVRSEFVTALQIALRS